ncbi:MAG: aminodeoxychorismate synthase component I [Paludibacter sp.]|nr:aminodeoxychorismate synthase component I [Paludibacter sp.]
MNRFGSARQPFLFIIDFKAEKGFVIPEPDIQSDYIRFGISPEEQNNYTNNQVFKWDLHPVSKTDYATRFNFVADQIHKGNSFLVNLTQPTEVETNLTTEDFFNIGRAKYKLWLKNKFTVLSPETFVKIRNNKIFSYPMKGTIDATIPNAEKIILDDPKEKAEHATIVDLIRNDLSMVAENVTVTKYRYIDKIKTNKGGLLQVSSEIRGDLPEEFEQHLGDILFKLLPAGSVSGAPKPKTVEIIETVENYERGFYTGIFGWFDGTSLDSAVMIRYIEQKDEKLIFKSGGGITFQSDVDKEYAELIQKVYVPLH